MSTELHGHLLHRSRRVFVLLLIFCFFFTVLRLTMYDDRPVGGGVAIDFSETKVDFSNLSVECLLVHANWKARKESYDKVLLHPARYKSDLFINIKKICGENNMAGLEALMEVFCAVTPLATSDELDLLKGSPLAVSVEKGITGRPKCVAAAENFVSLLVENGVDVFPVLLPCFAHHAPKNKIASVHLCSVLISQYGVGPFPTQRIMAALKPCFSDASPQVRKEACAVCCEVYKYSGEGIYQFIQDIRDGQLQELEKQFASIKPSKGPPKRVKGAQKEIDSFARAPARESEKAQPVDDQNSSRGFDSAILSRLPKNFFAKALDKSTPWQDRCALINDVLMPLLSAPRFKRDNYHELATLMREYLVDPQAPPMLLGFKMIQECARGLGPDFNPHARSYLGILFDKMKDKKTSVQEHVSNTLEKLIVCECVSLDQCLDDIDMTASGKNPSQRLSVINFCIRMTGKLSSDNLGRFPTAFSILKKMVNDPVMENRERAYALVANLVAVFGEDAYEPVINSLEEKQKARLCSIISQTAPQKKVSGTPSSSPAKKVIRVEGQKPHSLSLSQEGSQENKGTSPAQQKAAKHSSSNLDDGISLESTLPHKDHAMTTMLGLSNGDTTILDLLRAKEWDRRYEGMEKINNVVDLWSPKASDKYFDILVVYLRFFPSFKESTFQVFQAVRNVVHATMLKTTCISPGSAYVLISEFTPRLAEPKNKIPIRETLSYLIPIFGLRFVLRHMISVAAQIHTPKLLIEVNEFSSEALQRQTPSTSDAPLHVKGIIEYIKNPCLEQLNPTVKISSINLLVALRGYVGPLIDEYIDGFPPAVRSAYEQEVSVSPNIAQGSHSSKTMTSKRCRSTSLTQGETSAGSTKSLTLEKNSSGLSYEPIKIIMRDMTGDLDWRKRLDAVHKAEEFVRSIDEETLPALLTEHLIKALSSRFSESNRNFVVDVLRAIPFVVEVSEPSASRGALLKYVAPSVLCMLGDLKANLRDEARNVSNRCMQTVGLDGLLQHLVKPLSSDSSVSRQNILELMLYGFDLLPQDALLSRNRLTQLVPGVVGTLMDRTSEVRLLAEQVANNMMMHIGADPFYRQVSQLKPAEQQTVTPIVDRYSQNLSTHDKMSDSVKGLHLRTFERQISSRDERRASSRGKSQNEEAPFNPRRPMSSDHAAGSPSETLSSGVVNSASSPKPVLPPTSREVYPIQEILAYICTVNTSTASKMCSDFMRHADKGVDCGSVEMIQAMVDRLSQSANHMEAGLVVQLSQCLSKMFTTSTSSQKCQNNFLFGILGTLFTCLLSEHFSQDPTVIKALNSMVLSLLEGCHADAVFSALLSRLTSYSTTYLQTGRKEDLKYVQVTVKCVLRHNIHKVAPENIILCCHEYLMQHPPSSFRSVDDLPVRTVKTVLQTATRQHGSHLLSISVRLIGPDNLVSHFLRACLETKEKAEENERLAREESEQQQRASKSATPKKKVPPTSHADPVIATRKITNPSPNSTLNSTAYERVVSQPVASFPSPNCSNASMTSTMGSVFNKIRNYQTSNEGIDELYHLLKGSNQNSEASQPFDYHFSRCSQPFQFFIKRKLEKMAEEDPSPAILPPSVHSLTTT